MDLQRIQALFVLDGISKSVLLRVDLASPKICQMIQMSILQSHCCSLATLSRFEQSSEVASAWNDATGQRKAPITPQSIDLSHDQKHILRAQRAPALSQSRKGKGRTN